MHMQYMHMQYTQMQKVQNDHVFLQQYIYSHCHTNCQFRSPPVGKRLHIQCLINCKQSTTLYVCVSANQLPCWCFNHLCYSCHAVTAWQSQAADFL